MKYISWLITLPLTAFALIFALFNRDDVDVVLSPLHDTLSLPLFVVGLGLLGIGFLTGATFVWINMQKLRWEKFQATRRVSHLEKELKDLAEKDKAKDTTPPPRHPRAGGNLALKNKPPRTPGSPRHTLMFLF